jgi:hypothetical protein
MGQLGVYPRVFLKSVQAARFQCVTGMAENKSVQVADSVGLRRMLIRKFWLYSDERWRSFLQVVV